VHGDGSFLFFGDAQKLFDDIHGGCGAVGEEEIVVSDAIIDET
jgi:hypothetical protein